MFFRKRSQAQKRKSNAGKGFSFEWLELESRVVPSQIHTNFMHAGSFVPAQGSASPSGMTPAQMRHAYGADAVMFGSVTGDGTGQTIAIVDAYNQPNIASDLAAFDSYYGLPAPPNLTVINQNGGTTLPGNAPSGGWGIEISLDVEWAHVIAPQASILLVEANSSGNDLYTAVDAARNHAGVSAVSMSWSQDEFSGDSSDDSHFTTPSGHIGVTFLAASGDVGAYSSTGSQNVVVQYPAASPNVVGVGGTTLSVNGSGDYQSESGWGYGTNSSWEGGSGGGISSITAQPSYQSGVVTQSTTHRTVPDVSMDGDPNTGASVYDTYDFGSGTPWETYGGTSLASPMYAGVIAIANQGRVLNGLGTLDGPSQTLPKLYAISASDLHDVTTGNNFYAAGAGYDLVTGRGTPLVNLLANSLASAPLTIGGFTVNPSTAPPGTPITLTATNVTEAGQTITGVNFYRESNGTTGLQIGSDTLVGAGTQSGTTWTLANVSTTGLSDGIYTFYAVASDGASNTSVASATLTLSNEILGWNVTGQTNFGTQDLAATTVVTGITNSLGLTRGSGVSTSGSYANNAWGGKNWASSSSGGISGNEFATFGFTVSAGATVSLSAIDMNYRRISSGPPNGLWQYQINGDSWTTFADVSNEFPNSTLSGGSINEISLSGISAFQNLTAGTVVNIQIVPYGASNSTGTWYVYDLTSDDLVLSGTVTVAQTATTTTITSNTPNPSTAGQSVAFNVAVSGGVPNGETVTLEDASNGNAVVGTGTLTSGLASINVSSLSVGTHDIIAAYGGDVNYAASQSSQVVQTVNPIPTATALVDNGPNPSFAGQSVSFTVTVSPTVPDGESISLEDASNGNAVVGTGTLTSGSATINVTSLSSGTHDIFAVYSGDATYAASQSSQVVQTVNQFTEILAWDVNGQTNFGTQDLAATTVAAGITNSLGLTRGSGVVATGSFANNAWGGKNWASSSSGGISGNEFATFGFTVAAGEEVSLSSIDMNYRRISSGPPNGLWQYQINGGDWTTIADVSNEFPNSTSSGGSISEISLSGISALQNLAAGAVVNIQIVPYGASNSTGTWYVFDLSGDDLILGGTVTATQTATTTTITSNTPNPSNAGQSVAFDVAVTGGVPDGETVTLEDASDGNAVVGTGTLAGGSATINVSSLSVGTHDIFAAFGGDATYAASQSDQVVQVVNFATTTTVGPDQAGPYTTSSSLTFTATITGNPNVGTVTFYAGPGLTNPIGSPVAVVNGSADSTPGYTFPAGSNTVTAVYSGGAGFAGSQGTVTIQVNSAAPPSVTNVVINQNISGIYDAAGQPFEGAQRSMVNDIVYTFSEPVTILDPSVDPSVFTIAIASGWTGAVPTLSWATVPGSGNTQWAVAFSGNGVSGGSIANGAYTITVNDPASITAESDSQALSLAPSGIGAATQSFYRLFGDINGDEVVNAADNAKFKQALTTYNTAFDYNQDGVVNAADNAKFKNDLTVNFSGFTATI